MADLESPEAFAERLLGVSDGYARGENQGAIDICGDYADLIRARDEAIRADERHSVECDACGERTGGHDVVTCAACAEKSAADEFEPNRYTHRRELERLRFERIIERKPK